MVNVTKDQIEALVKLQQFEIEIAKINAFLSNVTGRIEMLDSELEAFKQKMESEKTVVEEQNQKYRVYESDVQDNLAKIEKSEQKLSLVKTNKEYQSSLKEIEDIKSINAGLEDEMLSCLTLIENAENQMKAREQDFLRLSAETDTDREEINQETARKKESLVQLESDWTRVSSEIDSSLLDKFSQVKSGQANGIAVVSVKDAVCQGCNMNIPPQMYNELQRSDNLKYCPSCERIIYWANNDNRSE
jgi:predicted  nucleic acid-binding Zn-ribbon protein